MKKRGYDLSSLRARQLSTRDFLDFDLILAMDHQNFEDIHDLLQNAIFNLAVIKFEQKLH